MSPSSVSAPVATTMPVALPGRDERAREPHVGPVGEDGLGREHRLRLGDRNRLAGQRRLVDLQPADGGQPQVGADLVAGRSAGPGRPAPGRAPR